MFYIDLTLVRYEFNESFGADAKGFRDVYPTFHNSEMMLQWEAYIKNTFSPAGNPIPNPDVPSPKKHKCHELVHLDKNQWGEPILPATILEVNDTRLGLDYRRNIVRAYLTAFYSK